MNNDEHHHRFANSTSQLPLYQITTSDTSYGRKASRSPSPASTMRSDIKAQSPHYDKREDESPSGDKTASLVRQQREVSNLELFYDLFFTANLTVFTAVHEVRDSETLKQYVGFFCILWFTWYQVSLYDVRFASDSLFERIAKAVQFLVMIGFAVVGPKYNVGGAKEQAEDDAEGTTSEGYFKSLSIYLMISRMMLVFQYIQYIWLNRRNKQAYLPISLITATYFVAAMAYFGLIWTFRSVEEEHHTYRAWYAIAIIETVIATTISSVWRNISFKGTHLVQRMSLLTLIILGEGVIALATKSQRIVQSEGALEFTASTVANIFCAVLILYFIYMLYFDALVEDEHIGTIIQQVWSILHFPLHVALVLSVEGLAQCITWRAAVVRGNIFTNQYMQWQSMVNEGAYSEVGLQVNETAHYLIYRGLLTSRDLSETLEMLSYDLNNAANASAIISNGNEHPSLAKDALYWIYFTLYKTIYNIAGFDSPVQRTSLESALSPSPANETNPSGVDSEKVDFGSLSTFTDVLQSTQTTAGVFNLTYVYFFTSIGLVIILCMLVTYLSNHRLLLQKRLSGELESRKWEFLKLGFGALIGVGLCCTSFANLGNPRGGGFVFSPWVVPTVMLGLLVVVVVRGWKTGKGERWGFGRMGSVSGQGGRGPDGQREREGDEVELVERRDGDGRGRASGRV
ncbi:unnamed protein product [Cercospora beticola]|nr:unnamed protein product [Cercospora beticola]